MMAQRILRAGRTASTHTSFSLDLFASVNQDEMLIRIHSSAEEFEPIGEAFFVPGQVSGRSCTAVAQAL